MKRAVGAVTVAFAPVVFIVIVTKVEGTKWRRVRNQGSRLLFRSPADLPQLADLLRIAIILAMKHCFHGQAVPVGHSPMCIAASRGGHGVIGFGLGLGFRVRGSELELNEG